MKKHIFTYCILVLTSGSIFAQQQQLIAAQNGNIPSFYTSLDSAVINVQNGDTLYLPAAIFSLNTSIDKKLHFVGVGYHPDYTRALGITYITTPILLTENASGGSITGLFLTSDITTTTELVSDYSVKRCYLFSISGNFENLFLAESIIRGRIKDSNITVSSFYNNIFQCTNNSNVNKCVFKNNIFFSIQCDCSGCPLFYGNENLLENNVILNTEFRIDLFHQCIFRNNLMVCDWGGPDNQTNLFGSGNMVNQALESIFVNQSGDVFDYNHDYHIKDSSPGKNGGTDGTDVGIYGGRSPWKDGGIPFNPHFQSVKMESHTDSNGNLNVQIKVAAQER